jgi:hypothetical protein
VRRVDIDRILAEGATVVAEPEALRSNRVTRASNWNER